LMRFPVTCTRLAESGAALAAFSCEAVDLSAGGVRILTPHQLYLQERVRLDLAFAVPQFVLTVEATVVRVEAAADRSHVCALKFENVDSATQSDVVRFVFAQESRLARKQ